MMEKSPGEGVSMSDMNKHSFVHNIQIATPCKADWNKMTGDERTRFCHDCQLNVYNVSAMTIAEAEALIIEKEGRVCLRLYHRSDGTLITKDCPLGVRARLRKTASALAAVIAVIATWVLNFKESCTDASLWERISYAWNIGNNDEVSPTKHSPYQWTTGQVVMGGAEPINREAVMGKYAGREFNGNLKN